MSKQIINQTDLRKISLEAMTEIAAIVKRTLGPGGNAILIERKGQTLEGTPLGPKITKDGVSVADECFSSDPQKDVVIQAIKGMCRKTVQSVGDGTTSSIVLGEAILQESIKFLNNNPKVTPQIVKESIEEALQDVFKLLEKEVIPVHSTEMIKNVATISANGDSEIGELISKAFDKVGAEGVVTIDEGHTSKVVLSVVDGYQFGRGAEGRNAFFNNKDQTLFEAENARLIIYDGKLYSYTQLIPAFKILAGIGEDGQPTQKVPPMIIMANEFSPEVLQFLLVQKSEGGLSMCPILGPNTTHVRTGYYDDLAVYSGGTRLGNGSRNLESIEDEDIGLVSRAIVDKYKTTFYEGQGAEEDILVRVDQLKAARAQAESPYDAQVINDRLAALTQGIAKIAVGGVTELEIKEKYDRIEDALNAARVAIQYGVVLGGGTTLLRIANKLKKNTAGHKILSMALVAPFKQILENIGYSQSETKDLAFAVLKRKHMVFNAHSQKLEKGLKAGILDPAKVTRAALENAVSIATLLSTSGGAIIYTRDQKQ